MSKIHQRIFIAVDEWLGAVLCVYLWHAHREAFWTVFMFWAFCVYVIAYPSYFGWWAWAWRLWRSW
jgi:hypothetical protein